MQRVGSILLKVLKVMPIIGWVFVIASMPYVLQRKGYVLGTLAVTLDMLPVICLIKAGVEVFTGDLIPNKIEGAGAPSFEAAA
jgi:hypothetical protein